MLLNPCLSKTRGKELEKKARILSCVEINCQTICDSRGEINVLDGQKQLPFPINRIFFVHGANGERGAHAHRDLFEFILPIVGSLSVEVDDGQWRDKIRISSRRKGLLIPPLIWAEQKNFSSDSVYAVLASEKYCEDDYIRDYDEFLRMTSVK